MITLTQHRMDLHLSHPFRLSRGVSEMRRNAWVELEDGEHRGLGEAAPIARYQQDADSALAALAKMAAEVESPAAFATAARGVAVAGQPAAQAAFDMALRDLAGKRIGASLGEMMGIDPRATPITSFTIGLDTPENVAKKVREAPDYEVLKVKLGSENDRVLLEAVRDETDRPLRVDANEGWTFEEARENLEWLARMGVELVEQPLPSGDLEAMKALRRNSPLPLFADEDVGSAADVPRLADAFDGINVKLMKCGGIGEALDLIATARACGLEVMLGCMVESSLAITAAAWLSPLVDYADLDGNLLVTDDPFVGARVVAGRLVLPEGPGLGVEAR